MEFQWGNNPEYTLYLFIDLKYWALPGCIYWYKLVNIRTAIASNITIRFLCFALQFDIWEWNKKEKIND